MEITQIEQTKAVPNDEEEKMEIDSEPQTLVPKTSSGPRKPLFGNLDSKLAISEVLGFAFNWDELNRFFNLISKKGKEYFEKNQLQLRQFVNNETIEELTLYFGNRSFQYRRPENYARIG